MLGLYQDQIATIPLDLTMKTPRITSYEEPKIEFKICFQFEPKNRRNPRLPNVQDSSIEHSSIAVKQKKIIIFLSIAEEHKKLTK